MNSGDAFLKRLSAKNGVSNRQFTLDAALNRIREESDEVGDETIKTAADKLLIEKSALWKRLAKK